MDEHRHFLRSEIDISNVDRVGASLNLAAFLHRDDVIVDCMDLEFIGVAGFVMLATLGTDLAIESAHRSAVEDLRSAQFIPLAVPVARRPPRSSAGSASSRAVRSASEGA